jgi:hypothetical protein
MTTTITCILRAAAVVSITAGGLSTVLLAGLPIVSLATSLICAVVATFRHGRTVAGRIGVVILVVAATCVLIAAGGETGPINTAVDAYTQVARLHLLGASLDYSPLALIAAHAVRDAGHGRPIGLVVAHSVRNARQGCGYRLPRRSCSRSMASNRALKLPLPKPRDPCRSISSKNTVGRSPIGLVKICSR